MRNALNVLLSFLLLLFIVHSVFAFTEMSNGKINIYFFWAEGCPHCAAEKVFLDKLEQKYSNIKIYRLEVTKNFDNAKLLAKVGKKLNADVSGVPFTVVCTQYFIGWYNEETTGKALEDAIKFVLENNCSDVVSNLMTSKPENELEYQTPNSNMLPPKLTLPFLGEIDVKTFSLPVLTILIAAVDGFNPCAMWVLLFLVSLLFGLQNTKRMWLLGSTFIIASAVVYFLFMIAWLKLVTFLGFIFWVRIAIGSIALVTAYLNLKEYFMNPEGGCKVVGEKKRSFVFENIKKFVVEKNFIIAVIGILLLSFAVNLVELVCSLGLPAVYTQILSLSNLPSWLYYLYLALYVFIFILPLLFVFIVSLKTMELTALSTKHGRIMRLIGGIIMLVLGILLVFRPEWLIFA